MKYTVGEKKNGQIAVEFELSGKEWEAEIEKAYQKHKGDYKMQGFRQGKVPRKVLEQTYGEYIFFEDAFNDGFATHYTQMLEKEKEIFPVDYPQVSVQQMDAKGLKFTATITVLPDVVLGDYKGIEVKKDAVKVSASEVDHEISHLAEKQARFVEVTDRPAKEGDLTNIDYSGSVDGVKFEGGTAQDQELTLGSHMFIEGFEEQVVGMNIGEEKDINVTFPKPYHSKDLEGKPAVFHVKLLGIREKVLPEINDEFAYNASEFETLKDLKADIKAKLTEEKQKQAEAKLENELISAIVKNAKVEVPHSMVDSQIDHEIQDMSQRLAYQGLKFDQYLEYMGTTMENFRASRHEEAEKAVKTSLVMEEIIKQEKIEVTKEDIDAKLEEIAKASGRKVDDLQKDMKNGQEQFLKNTILSEKVIKHLKEINNIK